MSRNKNTKRNLKEHFSFMSFATVVVCLTVFSLVQFRFMDDIFAYVARINMVDTATKISTVDVSDRHYLAMLSEYEAENDIYIEIYSPRDVLVYTTRSNETIYNSASDGLGELKPRIMRLLSQIQLDDGSYFEIRQEYFTSAQYIVYGAFFEGDVGIVLYKSVDVIKDNSLVASWTIFGLSLFALVMFFVITFYYSNLFVNPLRRIINTTKKIAGMNFDESCPSFRIKELDELSKNINILSASLNKALNDLKIENYQLEMDIETERKIDKTRRTFLANVSHELKTPISIIQAYAEGMKYGIGCDSTEEFCDIIIEEAQKMNNLVVRIMEYLQYGTGKYVIKQSEFNIKSLISGCILSRALQLEEKGISIEESIDEGLMGFADKDLMCNVFNNYLSNAISHIDFEKKIIVKSEDMGSSVRISVFNTGLPIPGTDIENIWQSFYRADKSHSRKEGRFGLGLSVVATLQDLHGEKYGVINGEKGVEFWFDIKKAENKD